MPKPIHKNLNFCFAKINRSSHRSDHLFRPSFSNPFLKTFNSLYDLTFDRTNSKSSALSVVSDGLYSSSDSNSDYLTGSTPDFATILASRRFFFSSPGRSNSIVDSSSSASICSVASSSSSSSPAAQPEEPDNILLVDRSVAVPTYSPDPFMDFRRSMQEMVDAHDELIDWEFLQQLFMCYLALNPKSTHKFILGAFADLLVSLVISSPPVTECRRSDFSDQVNSRRCM